MIVCVCVWSGGGEVLHTTGQFVVTLRYCYVQLNHVVLITKGFAMIVCVCVGFPYTIPILGAKPGSVSVFFHLVLLFRVCQ